MSSNTLRGIGQDEGGDNDVTPPTGKDKDKDAGAPLANGVDGGVVAGAPGGDATERTEDGSAHLTERGQERVSDLRIIRSLDSTVPGTRSLDSSVPEARPPLDAKVPALASTLLGVAAPIVSRGDREKGTVQGRDVHLPVEAQRVAGIHSAVAPAVGANLHLEAAPHPIDRSEPTLADPVRTAALAHVAGTAEGVRGHAHADLNSHGPWYDQDPTGGQDVYEDRKPSVLGKVAIGVAVAAGLSVIVFAILRLASADDRDTRPAAAVDPYGFPANPTSPSSPSSPSSPPSRTPAALPVGATGSVPLEGSSAQDDLPPQGLGAPSGDGSLNIDSPEGLTARRRKPPMAATRPGAGSKPGVAAAPGKAAGHGVVAAPGPTAAAAPLSNELATPSLTTPPPLAGATTEQSNSANSANSANTAPASPPPGSAKPAASDKPRGKNYDPDSTLPLNID